MQLKLRSYRGFIIKFLIPFFVMFTLLTVIISICHILYPEDSEDILIYYIISGIMAAVMLCLILFVKFYNKTYYVFEKDKINVFNGKDFVAKIDIANIEKLVYHPFKFRDMVTIFYDERLGVWKLHVLLKNGTRKSLAFFSIKDVKKIKEIYGDLVEIV